MTKTEIIKHYSKQLKLSGLTNNLDGLLENAKNNQVSYLELIKAVLESEITHRMQKDQERRFKQAGLPLSHDLDQFNFDAESGLEKQQLNQLRELDWIEQIFNIILMGPSGTGKTYIASGLCFDAVKKGYRAYFRTMEEIINILKMKDITRTAMAEYKKIARSHLLAIDDIMMFPITKTDAVAFFNLINELHDKTSLIITTNKSPKQWAEVLNDSVLATALLDRILFRCEIIKLSGTSYRMKNRKTIFNN